MSQSMKIAFATKDMESVNAHFGGAKVFVVYDVAAQGYQCSGVINIDTAQYEEDQKTEYRVKALDGIHIMYCESIGATAAAKVIRAGIHPMKVSEPTPISAILDQMVKMLNTNPPPWIRRILSKGEAA